MSKRWTKNEDNILRSVYKNNTKEDIEKAIEKPWTAIKRRAYKLGLKRNDDVVNKDRVKRGPRKDSYSDEELNLIKAIFVNSTKKEILLAFEKKGFKRSWQSIYCNAKNMGLVRDEELVKNEMIEGGKNVPEREDFWSTEEDTLLKNVYSTLRKNEIQNKFPKRSWLAIRQRAAKLGVQRDAYLIRLDNIENSQKTLLKKHGVKSSFSLPETKNKIKQAHKRNLGVEYPMQSTSVKKKAIESVIKKGSFTVSNREVEFFFKLSDIDPNVQCQVVHPVVHNVIDFFSPMYNVWIQYDGSYWHGKEIRKATGPRHERIKETVLRDKKQNEIIPNLLRFWSDEKYSVEDIKAKLEEKGKVHKECHQFLKKQEFFDFDKENLNFDYKKIKANDFVLSNDVLTDEIVSFINKYEWLGSIGNTPKWVFTAKYEKHLAGVVLINEPVTYSKLLGEATPRYEAIIQRGATASWTPKNLGSRLIMFSCRWMVKNTEKRLFVAYGDPKAHEIGTIYQACNFDYLGDGFGSNFLYQHPLIKKGIYFSDRTLRRTSHFKRWCKLEGIEPPKEWFKKNRYKDMSKIPYEIKEKYKNWISTILGQSKKIRIDKKHKYALVLPKDKKEKKELNGLINYSKKPYPKRS